MLLSANIAFFTTILTPFHTIRTANDFTICKLRSHISLENAAISHTTGRNLYQRQ